MADQRKLQPNSDENMVVPYIEGTIINRDQYINKEYQDAIDTMDYFNSELIAPMTYTEQKERLNQPPKLDDFKSGPSGATWKTLPIEYIDRRLDEVFGLGNWEQILRTDIPSILRYDEKGIIFVCLSILKVRWANGDYTIHKGTGQSMWRYNTAHISFSDTNAWLSCQSESRKNAAKKLGLLMGRGVKELEEDGLLEQGTSTDTKDIITASIGTRIFSDDISNNRETILTLEMLKSFVERTIGETLDNMSAKGRKVIGDLLVTLPTVAQKAELMQRGAALGESFGFEMSVVDMKKVIAALEAIKADKISNDINSALNIGL